jgi:hypothetical protein
MAKWENDQHPVKAGMFLGLLMEHGIEVKPVMDESGYTPDIDIVATIADASTVIRIRVLP